MATTKCSTSDNIFLVQALSTTISGGNREDMTTTFNAEYWNFAETAVLFQDKEKIEKLIVDLDYIQFAELKDVVTIKNGVSFVESATITINNQYIISFSPAHFAAAVFDVIQRRYDFAEEYDS